ncbi:VirB8/TrbF family protein [Vibrio coralliilyticus]|uniref:VirB8/TrbF family protein n=1 Tax=Vibrio coralliilyticus TaxID=190893 RepID=UPI00211E2CDF|nr:VirB8/TrbF family protein [Vibrio coralliilyticus]
MVSRLANDELAPAMVVDETETEELEPVKSENANLKAERNRWFVFCLSLVVALVLAVVLLFFAFLKAQTTKEILYVKLMPNGSWSVIDYKPQDKQLYFKTTVDSLLEQFVETRYGINPEKIESDWGEASVFMSPKLKEQFIDKRGFDALGKIKRIKKLKNTAVISDVDIDHYDNIDWTLSDDSTVESVKSNIYFSRQVTVGGKERPVERLVLSVSWRLLPKKEITEQTKEVIRLNPIGVEVLDYKLKKERTSD